MDMMRQVFVISDFFTNNLLLEISTIMICTDVSNKIAFCRERQIEHLSYISL